MSIEAGLVHLRAEEFAEAEAQFREVLVLDEASAVAHVNLGMVLLIQLKVDEAIAHLKKAIEQNPRLVEAHLNLGGALLLTGDLEGAEAAFIKGTQVAPDQADIHYNLGVLYSRSDQLEKARRAFERVCQLVPRHGQASLMLGLLALSHKEFYPAAANLMLALEAMPKWLEAQVALGEAWRGLGRLELARQVLERACADHPGAATPVIRLAVLLAQVGEWETSLALLQNVRAQGIRDGEVLELIGLLFENLGRQQEAKELYEQLLLERPEHPAALEGLERVEAMASGLF